MIYIYALLDPVTQQVRYIGKTIRLKERLANQCNERSRTHRCYWIQGLLAQGLKPEQVILETLPDGSEWEWREMFWIAKGRQLQWPLVNATSGGDGVKNLAPESRQRIVKAWIGRKHRPESLIKIGQASRGRKHSNEYKEFMKKKMKERDFSETHKQRLSKAVAKLTDEQVREIRAKLANKVSQYAIADEYNVHQGTISNIKRGISYSDVV